MFANTLNFPEGVSGAIIMLLILLFVLYLLIKINIHKSRIISHGKIDGWDFTEISWQPSPLDRSNSVYRISYLDLRGNKHERMAKISFWDGLWFSDDEITEYKSAVGPENIKMSYDELVIENKKLHKMNQELQLKLKEIEHLSNLKR